MGAENIHGIDAFFRDTSLVENGFVPEGQHPLEFAPYTDIWDTLQFPNYPEMPSYRLGLLFHVIYADINFRPLYESDGDLIDFMSRIKSLLEGKQISYLSPDWFNSSPIPSLHDFVWNNIAIGASCTVVIPNHYPIRFSNIIRHWFGFDIEEVRQEETKRGRELKSKKEAVTLALGGLVACWFAHNPEEFSYASYASWTYRDRLRFYRSNDGTLRHSVGLINNYRTYQGYTNYKAEQMHKVRNSGDQRGFYQKRILRKPGKPRRSTYYRDLEAVGFIEY